VHYHYLVFARCQCHLLLLHLLLLHDPISWHFHRMSIIVYSIQWGNEGLHLGFVQMRTQSTKDALVNALPLSPRRIYFSSCSSYVMDFFRFHSAEGRGRVGVDQGTKTHIDIFDDLLHGYDQRIFACNWKSNGTVISDQSPME